MSRDLTLVLPELGGKTEFHLIYQHNGVWEPFWEPLRETELAGLIPRVRKEDKDHALWGWAKPLAQSLGLEPRGCIVKVSETDRKCRNRKTCILHDFTRCDARFRPLPTCFHPGSLPAHAELCGYELLRLWHAGVYPVVVCEESWT